MERIKVLLIEDNPGDARLIQDMLADARNTEFAIDWKQTLTEGLKNLGEKEYDAVLLDLGLPDSPQRSVTYTRVQTTAPTLPIIILTGLDDDTFAATTVRRGAQDYLVKGRIDTNTLVRTIRYAIARKLGGDRLFDAAELARYDGKESRAAYIAFRGKVYDATNSRLWKEGKRSVVHFAGQNLTEAIARAPHGEDVLARLPVVGYLAKKRTFQQILLLRIQSLHPHTTFVHLTVACTFIAPFTFALDIFNKGAVFELITRYLLVLGFTTLPFSFVTGLISWIVSYESKATRVFNLKIALGILLFLMILGTLLWLITGAEAATSEPGKYFFLVSLVIQFCLALLLDYYGKNILYSIQT